MLAAAIHSLLLMVRPPPAAAAGAADGCAGLSARDLEAARRALSAWAVLHVAVGKGRGDYMLNVEYWGDFTRALEPLAPDLPYEDLLLLDNGSTCAAAVAASRLLVSPWTFVRTLDRWLSPDWLVNMLHWDRLLADGWGAVFLVLARQIPRNTSKLPPLPLNLFPALPPPQYEGRGPVSWARKAQVAIRRWHRLVCAGCWIQEFILIARFERVLLGLWDHARAWRRTFSRQLSAPGGGSVLANVFPRKAGLRCSSGGRDPLTRIPRLVCLPWSLDIAAPFAADFSAPAPRAADAGAGVPAAAASVAVCVTGPLRTMLQTAGLRSVRQHLAEALRADAFAYVPVDPDDSEGIRGTVTALAAELGPIRTLIVAKEMYLAELAMALGRVVLEGSYEDYPGNWRAPLYKEDSGNLLMLFQQAVCREMVAAHEGQRAARYEYVVFSRIDFLWMAPHPPVHLSGLRGRAALWIPRNEDWGNGGINDRHAAMTREASDAYLSRWHRIAGGRVDPLLTRPRGSTLTSGEQLLRRQLSDSGVQVLRFDPVAFLLCCEPGPSCMHQAGGDRPFTRYVRPYCAKYPTEVFTVIMTVTGWGSYWRLPRGRWAQPPAWAWERALPSLPLPARGGLRERSGGAGDGDKQQEHGTLRMEKETRTLRRDEYIEMLESLWSSADSRGAVAGGLLGMETRAGDWELRCCSNRHGAASCWAWVWRRQCSCLK